MNKLDKPCTICTSEKRPAIELALVHRLSREVIARRFGVSADAVGRHARNHLSAAARAALLTNSKPTAVDVEALRESEGQNLLAGLLHQRARLQTYIDVATENGDTHAAIKAENAILANLNTVGRLLAQFVTHHEIKSTSILISPDYLALRAAILRALTPYADAKAAVGRAIAEIEAVAADEIMARANAPKLIEAQPAEAMQ